MTYNDIHNFKCGKIKILKTNVTLALDYTSYQPNANVKSTKNREMFLNECS